MGDVYTNPPQSRNEAILRATIDGVEYTAPPQSRIEDLLLELKAAIEGGGGGGGTTVVANPSGEATADLNKLQVGTTIYALVTKAVSDLTNYYTKTQTYTKTEIDTIASNIKNSRFEIVSSLPTTDIQTNVIYLVPKSTTQTSNTYDEYINLDGTSTGWEKIGDTEIDLSDYVTTSALNTALTDYTTTANLAAVALSNSYADLDDRPTLGTAAAKDTTSAVTQDSTDPITSGAVYTKLSTDYYTKTEVDNQEKGMVRYAGSTLLSTLISGHATYLASEYEDKFFTVTDGGTIDAASVGYFTSSFSAGDVIPAGQHIAIVNVGTEALPDYRFDDFGGYVDLSDINASLDALDNAVSSSLIEVGTTGWTQDTTSQSGVTLWKKEINLTHVYKDTPDVSIGAASGLPTTAQQTAYDLLKYVTVDSALLKLYLYASAAPSNAYYINVEGVD